MIASDGRESIPISEPFCWTVMLAEGVLTQLRDRDAHDLAIQLVEDIREQVMSHKRGARSALELHQIAAAWVRLIQIGRNLFLSAVFSNTIGCLPTRSKLTP